MVSFYEYHDVPIEDKELIEKGYTKVSLPLNGHDKLIVKNVDENKCLFCEFHRTHDIDECLLSIENRLALDNSIDDNTGHDLVTYIKHKLYEIKEDPDLPFFKVKKPIQMQEQKSISSTRIPKKHQNQNGNGNSKEKERRITNITSKSPVYKEDNSILAEAVSIGTGLQSRSVWLVSKYIADDGSSTQPPEISIQDKIVTYEDSQEIEYLSTPSRASLLYEPYIFTSKEEILNLINEVKTKDNPQTLFYMIKYQWKRYVNESDIHLSLCAADCIFTIFQDRIGITHYLFFVADTEAGKSSNLHLFARLAYRAFMGIDISTANIYRFYGKEYAGIGTLIEDEIDDLDDQHEKLKMYKSGYTKGFKVPKNEKTSDSVGYDQEGYNLFGFKAFAAERRPVSHKAKGFNERTIEMRCGFGLVDYDIADVINDETNPTYRMLLAELNSLRNRLLIYRLLHYFDVIPDLPTDLKGREKQIWKPLLRLFNRPDCKATFDNLQEVVKYYISEYREKKKNTHTAFLVDLIRNLIKENNGDYTLESGLIWERYKEALPAGEEEGKTTYNSPEFGRWTQKSLIQTLTDQFKAKPPKHTGKKRQLVFDKTTLERLIDKYRLPKIGLETDEADETDVSLDAYDSAKSSHINNSSTEQANQDNSTNNEENEENHTSENSEKTPDTSNDVSHPYHVSHVSQDDSTNTIDSNNSTDTHTECKSEPKPDPEAYWNNGKWKERI